MLVIFRTDSSIDIGTGHVMRCITLADALAANGVDCEFISRMHEGNLIEFIRSKGYVVHALPIYSEVRATSKLRAPEAFADDFSHTHWLGATQAQDTGACSPILAARMADWLIVDHYAIDALWECALMPHYRKLMVIDDLADRYHVCDLLLDQNLGRQAKDYSGLLSSQTQTLIGPEYALLRPEFAQWREHSLQRRAQPQLKNLLITMGGVDQANATGQVLDALTCCELPTDLRITVVMGPTAPWLAQLQAQATTMPRPTQVLAGVNNMAQLMAESDFCIGAAGGSAWERCALGLPTLVLILAPNQHSGAMALQSHEAAWVAADAQQLMAKMSALFNNKMQTAALQKMSQAAAKLATGNGVSQVVELLLEPHV